VWRDNLGDGENQGNGGSCGNDEAEVLYKIGRFYGLERLEFSQALAPLEQSLSIFQEISDDEGVAKVSQLINHVKSYSPKSS